MSEVINKTTSEAAASGTRDRRPRLWRRGAKAVGRGIVSPWTACRSRASRRASTVAMIAVIMAIVSSAGYQFFIPVTGDGPDEPGHYAVVKFIAENGTTPHVESAGFRAQVIEFSVQDREKIVKLKYPYVSYATMPPGAYTFSAMTALLPSDTSHSDIRQARIPQALWAALTVLFIFLAAGAAFPSRAGQIGVIAVVLAAFWPRLTFTAGYVNNDAMMVAATAGIFWRWWEGYRNSWQTRDGVWLGVMLGAAIIAKPNGYIVAAMSIFVAVICLQRPFLKYLRTVGIAGVIAVIPALPWLYLSFRRYGLDIFATDEVAQMVDDLPASDLSASHRGIEYFEFIKGYWADPMMRSYVAWAQLPVWGSALITGIVAIAVVGLLLRVVDSFGSLKNTARQRSAWIHLTCVLVFPALLIASSINSYANDSYFGMQGRYIMPAFAFSLVYASFGIVYAVKTRRAVGLMVGLIAAGMGGLSWYIFDAQLVTGKESALPRGAADIQHWVTGSWHAAAGLLVVAALWYAIRGDETVSDKDSTLQPAQS